METAAMKCASRIRKIAATAFVPVLLFAVPGRANAMELRQYDQMSRHDQSLYDVDLVTGTIELLKAEGKSEDAKKMSILFDMSLPGKISLGMAEYIENLDAARRLDKDRGETGKRVPVEYALMMTLKDNGIAIPQKIMTVNRDFRPTVK